MKHAARVGHAELDGRAVIAVAREEVVDLTVGGEEALPLAADLHRP